MTAPLPAPGRLGRVAERVLLAVEGCPGMSLARVAEDAAAAGYPARSVFRAASVLRAQGLLDGWPAPGGVRLAVTRRGMAALHGVDYGEEAA